MTPDDVYALVVERHDYLQRLIWGASIFVSLLIFAQIVVKVVVFGRFWKQLKRLDGLLKLAELHGELTDAQTAREVHHLTAVKAEVTVVKGKADDIEKKVTAVKQVVDKTAPLVIAAMGEHPSGTGLPPGVVDPGKPPKRRAEDKKP